MLSNPHLKGRVFRIVFVIEIKTTGDTSKWTAPDGRFAPPLDYMLQASLYAYLLNVDKLTLQRPKHVGFSYTFTSRYTRKHIRLMSFYKTFTTKDAMASISDSIRLMSKPLYILYLKEEST